MTVATISALLKRRRRRGRGLVYVETLIALPVVFIFTMMLYQLTDYFTAVILMKHAAIAAARAAAVVGPDSPKHYGGQAINDLRGGQRLNDVRQAVKLALSSKAQFNDDAFVVVVDAPGQNFEMITARVSVDYKCFVPYLTAVCGFSNARKIRTTGSFPYQGGSPGFD